jgi:hypothetical protein
MPKQLPSHQPALDAYEEVEEARTAFFDAVSAWREGLDLTPLQNAFATWQKAMETYNETVSALAAAYGECIGNHADQWQASARGHQGQEVATTFEHGQMAPDTEEALRFTRDCDAGWRVTCDKTGFLPKAPERSIPEVV